MAGLTSLSDNELLSLLKEGEVNAFRELFDRYDRVLFIYAFKKLRDKEEAKDIVQDVFTNLWNSRNVITIQNTLSVYLYTSVRNKALNLFRDKKISSRYLDSLQGFLLATSDTTDHKIREKDIKVLIEKEIAMLPPKMREVFDLRRRDHLSNKEIAERLSISEHTVATHIKRALKTLRLRLGLLAYLLILLNY